MMKPSGKMDALARIHMMLYDMGATASSAGVFQTAYAIYLVQCQPKKLLLATRRLYPEVARHYCTNGRAVEWNIRRTVAAIWRNNPRLAKAIKRPTPVQFIAMMAESARDR